MNPSAPVTRTRRPASDRSATAARPFELVPLSDVDPVVLDLEGADRLAAVEGPAEQLRHAQRPARRDTGRERRADRVDPGADVAFEGRLLLERHDPVAIALNAPERDRVEVATDPDGRGECTPIVEV